MCAKSVFCFGGQKLETLFLANLKLCILKINDKALHNYILDRSPLTFIVKDSFLLHFPLFLGLSFKSQGLELGSSVWSNRQVKLDEKGKTPET